MKNLTETLIAEYGFQTRLETALNAIENGDDFNGTIYGKKNKHNVDLSIYVDNKFFSLGRISNCDVAAAKSEFLELAKAKKQTAKNMSYADTYEKYGFDAAEEKN